MVVGVDSFIILLCGNCCFDSSLADFLYSEFAIFTSGWSEELKVNRSFILAILWKIKSGCWLLPGFNPNAVCCATLCMALHWILYIFNQYCWWIWWGNGPVVLRKCIICSCCQPISIRYYGCLCFLSCLYLKLKSLDMWVVTWMLFVEASNLLQLPTLGCCLYKVAKAWVIG